MLREIKGISHLRSGPDSRHVLHIRISHRKSGLTRILCMPSCLLNRNLHITKISTYILCISALQTYVVHKLPCRTNSLLDFPHSRLTHLENIYTTNVSLSHILDVICLISNSRNAILKGNNVKIEE